METQNAQVRNLLGETSDEKTISLGITTLEELNDELVGWTAADIRLDSHDATPAATAAKLAPSTSHDPAEKRRERMRALMILLRRRRPAREIRHSREIIHGMTEEEYEWFLWLQGMR